MYTFPTISKLPTISKCYEMFLGIPRNSKSACSGHLFLQRVSKFIKGRGPPEGAELQLMDVDFADKKFNPVIEVPACDWVLHLRSFGCRTCCSMPAPSPATSSVIPNISKSFQRVPDKSAVPSHTPAFQDVQRPCCTIGQIVVSCVLCPFPKECSPRGKITAVQTLQVVGLVAAQSDQDIMEVFCNATAICRPREHFVHV